MICGMDSTLRHASINIVHKEVTASQRGHFDQETPFFLRAHRYVYGLLHICTLK